jgi:hypothetical protein
MRKFAWQNALNSQGPLAFWRFDGACCHRSQNEAQNRPAQENLQKPPMCDDGTHSFPPHIECRARLAALLQIWRNKTASLRSRLLQQNIEAALQNLMRADYNEHQ